ncbi:alpha/beta fold hydrolase [Amycolatopsis sp. cmx-4-68]|uniref:alpha/beta fold hydrolase n=1 Tax=Amycolatopsis sp. cmx-4-68 TaxID=2790938 RepID=UPI00397C7372
MAPGRVVTGSAGGAVEHHTARLRGERVHYLRAGSGDPVVLLHGWPQTSAAWSAILPALAATHTVIAPDLRGLGATSKALDGYDTDNVAADVHALVQLLDLGPIHLVGHDWGGAVAYSYAAQHRDGVRTLSVLEMVLPGFGLMEQAMIPQPHGGFLWHMGFQSVPGVAESLMSGREALYLNNMFQLYAYDPDAVRPDRMQHYVDAMQQVGALSAGLGYYRDYFVSAEQNREHGKEKLTVPVLALGGEACLGDLPRQCLEMAADDVVGGVIERCGHWIGEERPDHVAERLLAFFAGGGGSR